MPRPSSPGRRGIQRGGIWLGADRVAVEATSPSRRCVTASLLETMPTRATRDLRLEHKSPESFFGNGNPEMRGMEAKVGQVLARTTPRAGKPPEKLLSGGHTSWNCDFQLHLALLLSSRGGWDAAPQRDYCPPLGGGGKVHMCVLYRTALRGRRTRVDAPRPAAFKLVLGTVASTGAIFVNIPTKRNPV